MPPNVVSSPEPKIREHEKPEYKVVDYSKYKNSYRTLWGFFPAPLRFVVFAHMLAYHVAAVVVLFTFPYLEKKRTLLWNYVLGVAAVFGITAGVHRLWTHRSYKANLPVQIALSICYTLTGHYSIYNWVRDHRIHHKYSDTQADPFNVQRGFFFAQIGFLFIEKDPEVLKKAARIDSSDLLRDPVIGFNYKYYWQMQALFYVLIPVGVPCYFWGESLYWSLMISALRFVCCLHITTAVNSVAHQIGTKPYNKDHAAVENKIYSIFSLGEGWHNYHHAFPWDYKAAEFGHYSVNFTTMVLDFLAKFGWVYDMKVPSHELVKKFIIKHGDGTHFLYGNQEIPETEELNTKSKVNDDEVDKLITDATW